MKGKHSKRTTVLQGKYQNPWAPFGYLKSATERGKLEVDPQAAEIVRHIFALFLEGRGTVEIARTLNAGGVPTKSGYRAQQGDKMRWQYAGERNYWDAATVRSVLIDRRYIGSVVYGQRMAKGIAAHRNIKAPQEQLVEVEDCHEPLVSKEDFERTQAMLSKGRYYGKSDRPLAGKIKCGVCGHAMPLRRGKEPYFTCGTKWYDSDYTCGDLKIGQVALYETLWAALRQQIALRVDQAVLQRAQAEKRQQQRTKLEQELLAIEREQTQSRENMRIAFEKFAAGEMGTDDFTKFQQSHKRHIAQQALKFAEIRGQIAEMSGKTPYMEGFSLTGGIADDIIGDNGMGLSPEMLDGFIRQVWVYPDGAIEIEWDFNEY